MWELVASLRTLRDPARQSIHLPWIKCRTAPPGRARPDRAVRAGPADRLPGRLPHPAARHADAGLRRRARPGPAHRRPSGRRRGARVQGADPAVIERFTADPAAGVARVADALGPTGRRASPSSGRASTACWSATCCGGRAQLRPGRRPRAVRRRSTRRCAWTGERLLVDRPWCAIGGLHGDGLVLVPSAFYWPVGGRDVGAVPADARLSGAGRRDAVEQGPPPAPERAGRAHRPQQGAGSCSRSAEPSTTSALAGRMALTPGAVSQHLGVLQRRRARRSGCASASRSSTAAPRRRHAAAGAA